MYIMRPLSKIDVFRCRASSFIRAWQLAKHPRWLASLHASPFLLPASFLEQP